jgi:carbamoyl-phosphate synthase small subunit
MKALLALEDGFVLEGESFAGSGECSGEVVFNTGMAGYQEILTDPSYKGQIVTMTYPLIGNYGVNEEDMESDRIWLEGFIVGEASPIPSSWRSTGTLEEFLGKHGVLGVEGVDTRALTRHIREAGAMKGVMSAEDLDPSSLAGKAKASPGLVGRDLVREVTSSESRQWSGDGRYRVAAMDFGAKHSILRLLASHDIQVTLVPASTKAEEILDMDPDGVFLSNGPGDPAGVPYVVEEVKKLLGRKPVFGICLGQQLIGLALGFKTYKLKFGHHGVNHPVRNEATGKVEITSQNHGFCVDIESADVPVDVTHVNLNDRTLEGFRHREMPVFCVQYHPEAAPGPHDSSYLFDEFVASMEASR